MCTPPLGTRDIHQPLQSRSTSCRARLSPLGHYRPLPIHTTVNEGIAYLVGDGSMHSGFWSRTSAGHSQCAAWRRILKPMVKVLF